MSPEHTSKPDLPTLRAQLAGTLVTNDDVLEGAAHDQAPTADVGRALALVRARSRDDVVATLTWASRHGAPVVTQGARTGLSGGANAAGGCLLLDVSGMNAIRRLDVAERIAVVDPGVLNGDLSDAAREHGLFYPPDPASWCISTLGGNVATNAGGLYCVAYGVTKKFVRALEVVLANGRVLRTGTPTAKGVAGYDLTSLFVGSEDTRGVITEITVSLVPAPDDELVAVALFYSAAEACPAGTRYLEAGGRPSMLEFMDGPTLQLVQHLADLGFYASIDGMLIVGCDNAARQQREFAAFSRVCEAAVAEVFAAEDAADAEQFTAAHQLVGPAHEAVWRELVDDVCVPLTRTAKLIEGVRRIGVEHNVMVTTWPRTWATATLHPTMLYLPDATDDERRAVAAFEAIMRLGLAHGGAITGEHGIGRVKASMLPIELGAVSADVQRGVKQLLDPGGILNPGVMGLG